MIEFENIDEKKQQFMPQVCIKVIGVGGAGSNTINSMIDAGCENIEFIAANTDAQTLNLSKAEHVIQLGIKSTKGLGTGANPELGKRATEEDLEKVMELLHDADIVFLTGGLGGGTGSGGLPVIAHALKEKGILTIAVVTKPFLFEGKRRSQVADSSLEILKAAVDTLIVLPNQNLLSHVDASVSMIDAFSMINGVLYQSVKGISDIIARPGHINVDYADVKTILKDKGLAVIGTGKSRGENRALEAAQQAISSPLLENIDISGAHAVLLNITGGPSLTLHEISSIASIIYEKADKDANIIIGSVIDESMNEDLQVSILATGFYPLHENAQEASSEAKSSEVKHIEKEKESLPQQRVRERLPQTVVLKKEEEIHNNVESEDDLDTPTFMRQEQSEKVETFE